uniref:glycosyl hydrolase 115 family protein n=1 Tax=uncultured Dysgonomonas sp. TaxID=206096 RepID=UPI00263676E6|nr:glycosyl hydrolase 115 family protein [uncultured Dysgonomonas sp.]
MTKKNLYLIICLLLLVVPNTISAYDKEQFVFTQKNTSYFPLAVDGKPVSIHTDNSDYKGVLRAVNDLKEDLRKVTGNSPQQGATKFTLIIGTVGKSPTIDKLIQTGKIEAKDLKGKNEKYIIKTVTAPLEGIDAALVIAGSDKRGTIYGIYELSTQIGVSPWYYWADVPVVNQKNLYVKPGTYTEGEPAVQYRGIFLNDEAPALTRWSKATFGGFNHQFYEKVFELLLRLKGNFLWPAMWGSAFYDDDPLNGPLADEYGIVMGTSHHEPMALAQQDWKRRGEGAWDYTKNGEVLRKFWASGIERAKNWESLITIGMRGDGDEPMSEESNIDLLQKIVKDQRSIISKVTGKKAEQVPQVWALYKEVQDYYDKGMRVPDDVTLLLCDDNWGNVRKLPDLNAPKRKGGYGMYYHFDYVGAPRNSKWININPIPRVWEQMNLTYQYGVRKIWVVNVGDLKPMEYPISFFLDMAWNPDRFNANNLSQHTEQWAAQQFGTTHAKEISHLINMYSKYNRRVTPEILNDTIYSLENYNEWQRVKDEYQALSLEALKLFYLMPSEYRDSYDQLVLFPIQACANLYEMYYAVAMNRKLAAQKDVKANDWAEKVRSYYERDSILTYHYNNIMSSGKWNHMMDQTHIGYTYWQQPTENSMPKVTYVPDKQKTTVPYLFIDENGYISIEAEHYSRAMNGKTTDWLIIPDLGRTLSGVTTTPSTATPDENTYLEYDFETSYNGNATVYILLSPTLNFNDNKGLRYAVSINGGKEEIVNFNGQYNDQKIWWSWNAWAINETTVQQTISSSPTNRHTLRFRPLDPGIVLQKIMIDFGGLKPSYLGAPESKFEK